MTDFTPSGPLSPPGRPEHPGRPRKRFIQDDRLFTAGLLILVIGLVPLLIDRDWSEARTLVTVGLVLAITGIARYPGGR